MRKLCVVFALALAFCTLAEAAKKFPMTANSIVPAARGQVDVSKDKNGNVQVNLEVEFLANPQNLSPSASVYIVWLQELGGIAVNHGQLKMDKKLKASFETVTPFRSFDVFITGERDPNSKTPVGPEVLRTAVQP
jgi:hypothetical protein